MVQASSDKIRDDIALMKLTQIERYLEIEELNSTDSWVAIGEGTGIVTSTIHVPHQGNSVSLEMDKSTTGSTTGGYGKTISIDASNFPGPSILNWHIYNTDFATPNLDYAFLRLGTDLNNYVEYQIAQDDLISGHWNTISRLLTDYISQTGTGLDLSAITYIAFGVVMDGAGDTIADVLFDEVHILSAPHTVPIAGEAVISTDPAKNINVQRMGNKTVTTGSGNVGTGSSATQRTTLADDDPAVAGIGGIGDSEVSAGATGSLSAKLRRLTTDIDALNTLITTLVANYPTLDWTNAVYTKIDQTASAGVTVLTTGAAGSEYVYLMSLFGTMAVQGTITIEDEDGTDISGPMPVGANGGFVLGGGGFQVLRTPTIAKDLAINTSQKFYGHAICIVQ